jgi:hypothetical protein
MQVGKCDVYTSCYSSTWNEGHVSKEITCRLEITTPEGDEFSSWSDDPRETAKANVKAVCEARPEGAGCRVSLFLRYDSYQATSARLKAAADLMKAAETRLAAYAEEDGDPSSLAEAIRRGARALGIQRLWLEGADNDKSVQRGRTGEAIHLAEVGVITQDWFRRLEEIAGRVAAEYEEEKAKKEAAAAAA